MIRCEHYHIM